ncbi:hypothetical protein DPEC_G00018130 [Dallia pectoralis]|uniref:Uncharacterized protein n=1 Tax=Dallia pectoralis TaxID=75939 RepID=A0ACC2HG17_DALPE|nr:hypothetical protein DPEC_G00018130 [Dallia pectoralis]
MQNLDSSALVMALSTKSLVMRGKPSRLNCSLFTLRSRSTSDGSHSKMHTDRRLMKRGYRAWAPVVHPTASRRIKCQMSSLILRSGHPPNLACSFVVPSCEQQPQST